MLETFCIPTLSRYFLYLINCAPFSQSVMKPMSIAPTPSLPWRVSSRSLAIHTEERSSDGDLKRPEATERRVARAENANELARQIGANVPLGRLPEFSASAWKNQVTRRGRVFPVVC